MRIFKALLKKELKELLSTYKLIVVPIATILLMVSYPISMKLYPTLLKGELPDAVIKAIPIPATNEVLSNVFSNFESLGVLILILISMGAISGERDKSVAAMVLVKPVSRNAYVLSKWISYSILAIVSYLIGMLITTYYTITLFEGAMNWGDVTLGTLLYLPILIFIITLSIFYSTFMKSSVIGGLLAFATYLIIMKIPQYINDTLQYVSPFNLIQNANLLIMGDAFEIAGPLISTVCIIVIFMLFGMYVFRKQEI